MRSYFITSALTIALAFTGSIVPAVAEPIATPTATQQQTSEIDRAIIEGNRLYNESNVESVRKAIGQFEKAVQFSQSTNDKPKQALAFGWLGFIYNALGENKKALDYYNQSLLFYRIIGDRAGEATILTKISSVYSDLGENQKALELYNQALPISRVVGDRASESNILTGLGLVYSNLGEKQKALEFYTQALPMMRSVGNRVAESRTLLGMGAVYSALGENLKALQFYNQALFISHTMRDQMGEAAIILFIGRVYAGLGEKKKALEYYNQALPISRVVGDRTVEAKILTTIGEVYADLGEKQKALEYYNQALLISRAVGNRMLEATIVSSIGEIYSDLGEKQKALEYYNQALPISRAVEDRSSEATILTRLGLVYSDLGEKQKALEFYNQALLIMRSVGNRVAESRTLLGIGNVYSALGKNQKALDFFDQALSISRAVSDRTGEAGTMLFIGTVYLGLGEKKKALEFYNQALPISRAVGDRTSEAKILTTIGAVYSDLGDKKKALEFYNQALPISRVVGDRTVEAQILTVIGAVYSDLGDKKKALEFYNQALPISRAVGNRASEAFILLLAGIIYSDLGEKQQALEFYNQALPISRAVSDRTVEAGTLKWIAFVMTSQEQSELAIAVYKQSVNVYESIRKDNEKLPKELRESYTKSIASTYQALADLLIKQGRLPEAQAVLELLKLKELNTYTRDLPKNSPGISFTLTEQKALDEFLNTYGTAATFARQLSDCAEIKCPTLTKLENQRDRTNTIIREMLDRLRITLKDQVIDLSKLNTEEFNNAAKAIVNAQPGTVLIYPIITETKIQFLLAFKAGAGNNAAVTFRAIDGETINSETVFKTAQTFRESLQSPNSDLPKLKATSQQLYRWLIKPLEPEINQPHIKHLVFATDRVTRNLPIAALHDGQNYLITKPYSLSTITSATGTTPNALPPTSPKVLAVGASQFTGGASALPYVEAETNAIVQTSQTPKGIFPGDRFLNQQFTFDTLKSNLSNHNILHIATHGFLDAGNIDNSHLLTSNGDKIDKSKIQLLNDYGLNNIHLVILSACNTATGGKNSDGLEIAGISHYFMKNGTKSVIASLWQVNDPATALFMQQFYQHIQSGKTKAKALQQVQQSFIIDRLTLKDAEAIDRAGVRLYIPGQLPHNSLAHPYYWAPFILIGNNL